MTFGGRKYRKPKEIKYRKPKVARKNRVRGACVTRVKKKVGGRPSWLCRSQQRVASLS